MRACFGVGEGNLRDAFRGGLRVDGAVGVEDTAVTVRGVLAETDVGRDVEIREERSEFADGEDDGTGRVICWGAARVLVSGATSEWGRTR